MKEQKPDVFLKAPADAKALHKEAKRLQREKQRKHFWQTYGPQANTQTGGAK